MGTSQPTIDPTTSLPTFDPTVSNPSHFPTNIPTSSQPTYHPTEYPSLFPSDTCTTYVCDEDLHKTNVQVEDLVMIIEVLSEDFKRQQELIEDQNHVIETLAARISE